MGYSPLSSAQVNAFLEYLELPLETVQTLKRGPNDPAALKAITSLQQAHLARVPFENLDGHYISPQRAALAKMPFENVDLTEISSGCMQLDSDLMLDKIVGRRRGGVCYEAHPLLVRLLLALGFHAYVTAGRLNATARHGAHPSLDKTKLYYSSSPWSHIVIVMTIGSQQYVVDTNLGYQGSPLPMLLAHDCPVFDTAPRQNRLIFETIGGANPDKRWWRVQVRQNPSSAWCDLYCFAESEWMPIDVEVLAKGIAALPSGWLAGHVVCCRALFEDGMPVGYLMIYHDELRRLRKDKMQVLQKFHSERERIVALERDFGIVLTMEEKKNIKQRPGYLAESFEYFG